MIAKNVVLMIAGFVLLALGLVGVALPVMPTTPFVLASAVCFSGSSKKLSGWIANSPFFGSFIQNYRKKTGVEMRVKIIALAFLWAGLGISIYFAEKIWLYVILVAVGVCVSAHILLLKTRKVNRDEDQDKD